MDCCASMMVFNSIDWTILTKEKLFFISNDGVIWLLFPNNEGVKSQKVAFSQHGALYTINNASKHCFKGKLRCGWKHVKVKQFKTCVESVIEAN